MEELPRNILYHIMSFVPFCGLTKKILHTQKKKIRVFGFLRRSVSLGSDNDFANIKKELFGLKNIRSVFFYEDSHIYISIEVKNLSYVFIYF